MGRGRWALGDRHGRFGAGGRLAERRLPAEVGQSNVSRGRSGGRDRRTFPPSPPSPGWRGPGGTRGRLRAPGPAGARGRPEAESVGDPRVSHGAALLLRFSPFSADRDCLLAFLGPNCENLRALAYESSS